MEVFREGERSVFNYIDIGCKVCIPLPIASPCEFADGVAPVKIYDDQCKTIKRVINRRGDTVCKLRHNFVGPFSEGLLVSISRKKFGFVNAEGRWVIEPRFDRVNPFVDGMARVESNGLFGLINKEGEFVWGPTKEGTVNADFHSIWTN